MSTTTTTYVNGYGVTYSDTLYVCGGGSLCPCTDGLTSSVAYSPKGQVRCLPCAGRLNWPINPERTS